MPIVINGSGTVSGITAGLTAASMPTGSVLQVLQAVKTDHFTIGTNAQDTWTDITGLSIAITPASSSNKIFVLGNVMGGSNGADGICYFRLLRGSTEIGSGSGGSSINSFSIFDSQGYSNSGDRDRAIHQNHIQYLDSPSTTSATTYKIQIRINTTGSATVNRYALNTNQGQSSQITVMEIAG
jgi:hypothetical protein